MTDLSKKITACIWAITWCCMALAILVGYGAVLESKQDLRLSLSRSRNFAEATNDKLTAALKSAATEQAKSEECIACSEEAIDELRKLHDQLILKSGPGPDDTNTIVALKLMKIISDFEIRVSGGTPEKGSVE